MARHQHHGHQRMLSMDTMHDPSDGIYQFGPGVWDSTYRALHSTTLNSTKRTDCPDPNSPRLALLLLIHFPHNHGLHCIQQEWVQITVKTNRYLSLEGTESQCFHFAQGSRGWARREPGCFHLGELHSSYSNVKSHLCSHCLFRRILPWNAAASP